MKSIIKWQEGRPEKSGTYLVMLSTREITVMEYYNPHTSSPYWIEDDEERFVIAWCDFKDIESLWEWLSKKILLDEASNL